ncbi:MAG: hypothetical protein IFK94_14440 [Acidobacteria bacterium]|uniref:DUF5666 domain-containing protein n=1 Tax=Candidatus Polarisedimenticola svalbardensis TaxID=2886004 RepID=A0A8J7C3N0_9BACT|nr:hypothetical protein [Candidatus Polarisedimenticola svalbardensis]
MRYQNQKRFVPIFAMVIALAMLAGCNGADELVQPGPNAEAEVTMGALTGALAGPSGDTSGDMIAGMMDLIQPSPLPMTAGNVEPVLLDPTCPETFELPSGISGTCSMAETGVMTWLFGGAILVDGDSVEVEGSMTSTPSAEQPEIGASYDIDYTASAFGARGSATWVATGTVLLDDAGDVIDYDLDMTHTITPVGGQTAVVRMMVDPTMLDMRLTGPMGGALGLELDRETMTGSLSLNGIQVATVSIEGGCAIIVSSIPAIPDQTVCSGSV